tara:strand:- start:7075 stop:8511 length:1437 start_codon:yes stop_codon:yes gene_type:complete
MKTMNTIIKFGIYRFPIRKKLCNSIFIVLVIPITLLSCEDFVQIDSPNDEIAGDVIFTSDETALGALDAVYHQLQDTGFSSGRTNSITIFCDTQSDILVNHSSSSTDDQAISPDSSINLSIWNSMYRRIYEVNTILEGVESSSSLSEVVMHQLIGEAKFIRAFCYFYLVNLYGRVPLIINTDYRGNAVMPQHEVPGIYEQIVTDLLESEALLDIKYQGEPRTRVNKGTVRAMLSRVYLYLEHWQQAEMYANKVIDDPLYTLSPDLNSVFLKESTETIWQLRPVSPNHNTWEGYYLILTQTPEAPLTQFSRSLSDSFLNSLESADLRKQLWIGELQTDAQNFYYPYKYRIKSGSDLKECSVVFRLAEQYLIRAEARAQMGVIDKAIEDLDVIRDRANLSLLSEANPGIGQEDLLKIIWNERKVEFFAEWGHRWMDLKRTGTIDSVLAETKPNWQSFRALFPIPEHELLNNPFLEPNTGY